MAVKLTKLILRETSWRAGTKYDERLQSVVDVHDKCEELDI